MRTGLATVGLPLDVLQAENGAEPGLAGLVPEELARSERAVPLRRHGASLTLALLNGRDYPTPAVTRSF